MIKKSFIKKHRKNLSDCSEISTKLSYIKCYNRKSCNRKMEQKENKTLNGVFFQNSSDSGRMAGH